MKSATEWLEDLQHRTAAHQASGNDPGPQARVLSLMRDVQADAMLEAARIRCFVCSGDSSRLEASVRRERYSRSPRGYAWVHQPIQDQPIQDASPIRRRHKPIGPCVCFADDILEAALAGGLIPDRIDRGVAGSEANSATGGGG